MCILSKTGPEQAIFEWSGHVGLPENSKHIHACSNWVLIVGYNCELKCMGIIIEI